MAGQDIKPAFGLLRPFGINPEWKLVHHKLGCFPVFAPVHSAPVLADGIKQILDDLGLAKTVIRAITTDQGGAAPLIASHFPEAAEVHCVGHLLNTILRRAFEKNNQGIAVGRTCSLYMQELSFVG